MELIKYAVNKFKFIYNNEPNENDVKNMIDHINSRLVTLNNKKEQLTNIIKEDDQKIIALKRDIATQYKLYKKPSVKRDLYKTLAGLKLNELHKIQNQRKLHFQIICIYTAMESELQSAKSIKDLTDVIVECNDGLKDTRQIINEETISNTLSKLTRQIDKLDIESITDNISDSTSELLGHLNRSSNGPEQLEDENILGELEEIYNDFDADIDLLEITHNSTTTVETIEKDTDIINKLTDMHPITTPPINNLPSKYKLITGVIAKK